MVAGGIAGDGTACNRNGGTSIINAPALVAGGIAGDRAVCYGKCSAGIVEDAAAVSAGRNIVLIHRAVFQRQRGPVPYARSIARRQIAVLDAQVPQGHRSGRDLDDAVGVAAAYDDVLVFPVDGQGLVYGQLAGRKLDGVVGVEYDGVSGRRAIDAPSQRVFARVRICRHRPGLLRKRVRRRRRNGRQQRQRGGRDPQSLFPCMSSFHLLSS